MAASASSGLTRRKVSESRARISRARVFRASSSSASTGSDVRIKVTFLCSFTGIRKDARLIGRSLAGRTRGQGTIHAVGSRSRVGAGHDPAGQLGFVDDLVTVTLLGQEELAVVGEVHLPRVAGDQRVEAGGLLSLLGTEDPPQPLGFLLP